MADTPKPVPNVETVPPPAAPPTEWDSRWGPKEYEFPGSKGRLRSFRESYGVYGVWLMCSALVALVLCLLAYGLDQQHFWFHICIELAVASLMLVLTVMFVERMLESRRERESKERWSIIRGDTFVSLNTNLMFIVRYALLDLREGPIQAGGMPHTSASYFKIEQDLLKKAELLKAETDSAVVKAWENKLTAWHGTLGPVFNLLRTVTAPHFLHSTRNRTLLRLVLGLEAMIGSSEVFMIDLHRPAFTGARNVEVGSNLEAVARIVNSCGIIRYYIEQAQICGLKDIDDWADN